MKKDIFNGYILESKRGYVKGQLIACPIILFALAGVFIFFAIEYGEQMQLPVKNFICVIAGVTILFGILYPIITLLCIRNYPKCKKIMPLLIYDINIFNDKEK